MTRLRLTLSLFVGVVQAQDAEGKPHAVLVDMLKTVHKVLRELQSETGSSENHKTNFHDLMMP